MNASLPAALDHPFPTPPAPGASIEIVPGVHWLRMPLPFALDHINLWLLEDGDGWTLVDCGFGSAQTRALWEGHFPTTLRGRPIRRLVVTHYHPDHLGNAAWLAARFGCAVTMTHAEFLTGHAIHAQHGAFALEAVLALFRTHGMAEDALASLATRGNAYKRGVPELPASIRSMIDGDAIDVGGASWKVITGHGHSPDHASLHAHAHGLLIAGDMLLPRISTNVAVGPAEPAADPVRRFLDSIARFDTLPADTLVLPSHGLPFRGIALRVAALVAHHAARLDELAQALAERGTASAVDIVPVLFRRSLDVHQQFFAMGEAIAHLNHLWHAGRARRIVGDGRLAFAPAP